MLQELARDFAAKSVKPHAAKIDRTGQFPFDLAREIGARGFQGLPYPVEFGGSNAGYTSHMLVLEQLCQASVAVGAIMAVTTVPAEAIFQFGTVEQKQRLLTPLAQGQWLGGIGFTESETGSDPNLITTVAKKSGTGYLIKGQKQFISLAPALNVAMIFAKQDKEKLNAYIVDTSSKGFVVREQLETMGLRGLGTSIVFLDNVYVPGENLIGQEGQGFEILLEAISVERLSVATQAVAVAQAALDAALDYARQRKAQGKPIAKLSSIQWLLAEMASRIEAARWLVYRTAFLRDQGLSIQTESSKAKLFASRAAVEATSMAMQVCGSYGTMKDMPLERFYRDAKMTEIYVGISEVHRAIVARSLI